MKISEMRKILKEFSTYKKVTIKNIFYFDLQKYIEEKYPNIDNKEFNFFFLNEKTRLQKRDEEYEKNNPKKTLRFSKSEYEKIEAEMKKGGIENFNYYAKSAILKQKIKLPIEQDLLFEINKIGNNLNQIAKAINSQDNKIQILTELVAIEKAIKSLK